MGRSPHTRATTRRRTYTGERVYVTLLPPGKWKKEKRNTEKYKRKEKKHFREL